MPFILGPSFSSSLSCFFFWAIIKAHEAGSKGVKSSPERSLSAGRQCGYKGSLATTRLPSRERSPTILFSYHLQRGRGVPVERRQVNICALPLAPHHDESCLVIGRLVSSEGFSTPHTVKGDKRTDASVKCPYAKKTYARHPVT